MIVTIRKRPVVLRVVHTQAMLFLKSTSERDGSDIQRLWNWMKDFQIDSESIKEDLVQIQNGCMSDPSLSDISKIKWLGSGLPLNCNPVEFHSVSKIYWRYQILNKDCPNEVITRFIIQWNYLFVLIGLYGWVRIIRSIQYGYPIRIPFKISGTEFI